MQTVKWKVDPLRHWPEALGAKLIDAAGYIPSFLNHYDEGDALEQLNEKYQHGGGWRALNGFTLEEDGRLTYPGDPDMFPLMQTEFKGDTVRIYEFGFVCVYSENDTYEVARMD